MTSMIEVLDRSLYPAYSDHWDDQLFREAILAHVDGRAVILDLGAGAGVVEHMNFRNLAGRVCGVDVDPRVVDNSMLDEGRIADVIEIPYPSAMFDVVFADNVMEHLADPLRVFQEVHRVLKPGGLFLFKTPNSAHYMPMVARFTPYRFHQLVNRMRGRAEVDTFPTLYRVNSPRAVTRVAGGAGLSVEKIELIEGRPEYMRMAWPLYLVGAAYERLVNSTKAFAMFRILLLAQLRKPAS